jgi:putative polymerase
LRRTDALRQPYQALAKGSRLTWLVGALIIGAISFNALLCFANTHITPINDSYVVGFEAVIITVAFLACYGTIESQYALRVTASISAIIIYTSLLAFIRSADQEVGIDLKIVRDLLIPVIFFLLGGGLNNIRAADSIVYAATSIILLFAMFEYFCLDTYLKVFSVTDYYVARGTLNALDPSLQFYGGLMASGLRPPEQGRELLPFLGDHRVSSLFLEPVGLGNFGCLVAFWAIVRSRMEQQPRLWSVAAGIALIILSDSRFSAAFLGVGFLILLISPRVTTPAVLAIPFVLIFGLYLAAANADAPHALLAPAGLSTQERLLYSGRVLLDFDIYNWLGIEAPRGDTSDAGYAYVISNLGLLGFTAFWLWFISLGGHSRHFRAFRNTTAVYFAALFCVAASQFTIKTAALLWFLMGTLSVARNQEVMGSGREIASLRERKTL